MENENKPFENNNEAPKTPETPQYVRAEDTAADDAAQSDADVTQLAQPVGQVYEGSTYAQNEDTRTSDPFEDTRAASADETRLAEPQHVDAEPAGTVPPQQGPAQTPGGKTRRKKTSGAAKVIAALLVGAIIGGAAGGIVGAKVGGSNTIQAVSTPRNTDEITYDESGNMTVSSIAAEATPAVVSVYNMTTAQSGLFGFGTQQSEGDSSETAQGYGSGVLISDDGMIVTNYHVIEGADSVVVNTEDGTQYDAQVLGADSNLDLALLKIDASGLPYLSFADSDQVQVGDMAVAIGNPLGSQFANTVTDGIVSGIDRQISSENGDIGYIQTNAAINNGNSGGALLNGQAQLIGINSLKVSASGMMSNVEGMGFAIPSNTVLDFVNSVKDGSNTNTSTKKAWIGISGYSLTEDLANQVGLDQTSGILVASVTSGGPAYEAGIRMGDVITAVDGTTIASFDDLSTYLGDKAPGDTITLSVNRSGQTSEVQVTLGEQQN